MNDYEFTLKFKLPDPNADAETHLEALAEAGCEDALVGIGQRGRIALDFTRRAASAYDAIASAVKDVKRAIPGAELVEASPDFVGLTDIADLIGFTRQNMRKLMLGHAATFPPAVHEGNPSLWHLASVLDWLGEAQSRPVDGILREIARTTMEFNIARQVRALPGAVLPKALAPLI
ncbi:DNA-binding protein [Arenimonas daejeonensis]|uniref:DNA-binding protein n=1 Tax=Arenimonas daejeonensis TaxID=370777 RepID=UPI0011BF9649|nr:DNA-binding protein [Arenimonas daejeonensis]